MRGKWGPKLPLAQISICVDALVFFLSCPLGDTVYSSMLLRLDLSTSLSLKVALFGGWGEGPLQTLHPKEHTAFGFFSAVTNFYYIGRPN